MERANGRFCYRDHQIGRHGYWRRVHKDSLPWPPEADEGVSMQHFANSSLPPKEGPRPPEVHAGDFVLDFDAHKDWLSLQHCWEEVDLFLKDARLTLQLDIDDVEIAFSGKGGFHLTVPSLVMGDWASIYTTQAYKLLAQSIRDELGLVTLDAPTLYKTDLERWRTHIARRCGGLPPIVQNDAYMLDILSKNSFFGRRRLIRRLNGPRDNGYYKIPLTYEEFQQGLDYIWELARERRFLPPRLPRVNTLLDRFVQLMIREFAENEERKRQHYQSAGVRWSGDDDFIPPEEIVLPRDSTAPLCVQRVLASPPAYGASNPPMVFLASYYRAKGMDLPLTVQLVRQWALSNVADPRKWKEREDDAESVSRAVYNNSYQFGFPFARNLRVIEPWECDGCPLRQILPLCRRDRPV